MVAKLTHHHNYDHHYYDWHEPMSMLATIWIQKALPNNLFWIVATVFLSEACLTHTTVHPSMEDKDSGLLRER